MRVKLVRIGNSYGIIVPRDIIKRLGIRRGDFLCIEVDGVRIIVSPEPVEPRCHPPPRKPLPDEARMALEEILWDTPMTPEEFLDIAEGRRHHPRRAYWVARMLQLMDWARILDVCDVYAIADVWSEARKYIRSESLRRDLDDAFAKYRRRLHAKGPGEG